MADRKDVRICRLHELVVRDASGHARAFRYGEQVEMTPALVEALGAYLEMFEPFNESPSIALPAQDEDVQE